MKHNEVNTSRPQDYFPDRREVLRELSLAASIGALVTHEVLWPSKWTVASERRSSPGDWGTVKGRVVWDESAKLPERRQVDFVKLKIQGEDLRFFTSQGPVYYEDWVIDPQTRAVQHVFIWLRSNSTERTPPPLPVHPSLKDVTGPDIIMDQEPLGYRPHAVALRVGQTLVVKNSSPIFHSLVWNSENNGQGNRAMPRDTEVRFEKVKFERTPILFSCAPHPWERAWVRIYDHPYFALTGPDGRFEIKLAPAGKARICVWQETLGFRGGKEGRFGQPIVIEAGATLDLGDLKIKPVS